VSAAVPWTRAAHGIALTVRLTPRGGRDAIDGIAILDDGQPVLKVRVRAAPSEGEANDALIGLIAKTLHVAPCAVTIAAGTTTRLKRLAIEGDAPMLIAALEKIVRAE
jgi:uncharacterized protein YggU (UPF0235/DUF167 family)